MPNNDPNLPNEPNPFLPKSDVNDSAKRESDSKEEDSSVDFSEVAPLDDGASGFIPLADLPEAPSAQSLTSWTEIIRRQREQSQAEADSNAIPATEPVKIDAPS